MYVKNKVIDIFFAKSSLNGVANTIGKKKNFERYPKFFFKYFARPSANWLILNELYIPVSELSL